MMNLEGCGSVRVSVTYVKALYQYVPGEAEENHKQLWIIGLCAEIRTGGFPNTNQDCYHYIAMFSEMIRMLRPGE
jgi:nucleoside-specific outer membrane channel protein Tsx